MFDCPGNVSRVPPLTDSPRAPNDCNVCEVSRQSTLRLLETNVRSGSVVQHVGSLTVRVVVHDLQTLDGKLRTWNEPRSKSVSEFAVSLDQL